MTSYQIASLTGHHQKWNREIQLLNFKHTCMRLEIYPFTANFMTKFWLYFLIWTKRIHVFISFVFEERKVIWGDDSDNECQICYFRGGHCKASLMDQHEAGHSYKCHARWFIWGVIWDLETGQICPFWWAARLCISAFICCWSTVSLNILNEYHLRST